MDITEAARTFHTAMCDAHQGRITPDEFRAMVRKLKAEMGEQGYEQAKIRAIAFADKA